MSGTKSNILIKRDNCIENNKDKHLRKVLNVLHLKSFRIVYIKDQKKGGKFEGKFNVMKTQIKRTIDGNGGFLFLPVCVCVCLKGVKGFYSRYELSIRRMVESFV